MARLQALTLLVTVLSASAFKPFGWTEKARTSPARAGVDYLESMSSAAPAKTMPGDYLSGMRSAAPAVQPAKTMPGDYLSAVHSAVPIQTTPAAAAERMPER